MKTVATSMVVLLCSGIVLAQKPEDDPQYRQRVVQQAFSEFSRGMYASWTERKLQRLGDGVAPEIMKLLADKQVSSNDAATATSLVQFAFSIPRMIQREGDRSPQSSLKLLDHLDERVNDAAVKAKIKSTREQLRQGARTTPTR